MHEPFSQGVAFAFARLLDNSYGGQFQFRHPAGVIDRKPVYEYYLVYPGRQLAQHMRK